MTEQEFITLLLEKSKDQNEEVFIPSEVTLKISDLGKFNIEIAERLSGKSANIYSKNFGNVEGIYQKDNFYKYLIQYSVEKDFITFFPSILKMYSNEK